MASLELFDVEEAGARPHNHGLRGGPGEENQLLRHAHRLTGIPGVLIHGRLDVGAPLRTAWQLAQAWRGSELIVLETSGHTSTDLGDHVMAATDRFARIPEE